MCSKFTYGEVGDQLGTVEGPSKRLHSRDEPTRNRGRGLGVVKENGDLVVRSSVWERDLPLSCDREGKDKGRNGRGFGSVGSL